MLTSLLAKGFQVSFHSHAEAILSVDFPEAVTEIETALLNLRIPIEEVIGSGGGETKGTQRLRRALSQLNWPKFKFTIKKIINQEERESISHEIDHVRTMPNGTRVALEIEWNNKDPFYDRDLENFKRLHADGAISVGVIVTRGKSLQDNMKALVRRFLVERQIHSFDDLEKWNYAPTPKQKAQIVRRMERDVDPIGFSDAFTDKFVSDKYGEATTHWRKLEDRVNRGVGNPCPLLLIGLPDSIITFDEAEIALAELTSDNPTDA